MSDPAKFIKKLENYKKNEIPDKIIQKIGKFLTDNKKTFLPEIIANASKAGEGLCKWVKAIYKYHFVY